jgi:hypothetical protein
MPKKDKKKTAAHKERVAQKVGICVKTIANWNRRLQSSRKRRPKAAKNAPVTMTTTTKISILIVYLSNTNERYHIPAINFSFVARSTAESH